MEKEDLKKGTILNISYLMLTFLLLSTIANYFNDRINFSVLYLLIFSFTLLSLFIYRLNGKLSSLLNSIFLLLFVMFFAFFFIGNQNTFDVFWILIIPFLSIMVMKYDRLKSYLILFNIILALMITLSYIFPKLIAYNQFALMSLFWASVFTSYISLHYKKVEDKLEKQVDDYQSNLENKVQNAMQDILDLNIDLEETQKEILTRLGTLGEYRSNETGAHVTRVGLYTEQLALLYGLNNKDAQLYKLTAPIHDIGKVGIADSILNKPAKLTEEEYETMKGHAFMGESILNDSSKPMIKLACDIAGTHHEKYDGSGYPRGLEGENIPLGGRLVAITDVFDALLSKRVYKDNWSIEEIVSFFEEQKGRHFDPKLTELFLKNIEIFVKIFKENQ